MKFFTAREKHKSPAISEEIKKCSEASYWIKQCRYLARAEDTATGTSVCRNCLPVRRKYENFGQFEYFRHHPVTQKPRSCLTFLPPSKFSARAQKLTILRNGQPNCLHFVAHNNFRRTRISMTKLLS